MSRKPAPAPTVRIVVRETDDPVREHELVKFLAELVARRRRAAALPHAEDD